MKNGWQKVKIGTVTEINPEAIGKDYPFDDIEYIDISSVGTGTLLGTTYYRKDDAPGRAKRIVRDLDTIISTVRPNRRSFLLIKNPRNNLIVSTGFAVIRATNKVDPRYVYYSINDQDFTDYLAAHAKGSAYPAVDTEIVSNAYINYPPLSTQHKIASILSAYDDLIENNTRRIKILEEMAQAIYREWFVEFRFPGVETHCCASLRQATPEEKMLTGKDVFPKGWEVKSLFDVAHVSYGFPFKAKDFTSEANGKPVIRIRNLKPQKSETYTTQSVDEKYCIQNGDILVGMDGDFNVIIWAGGEAYQNQRIVRFRSKGMLPAFFLAIALEKPIQFFDSTVTGTTVAHLSDEDLRSIFFIVPSTSILSSIKKILDPMYDSRINLIVKNTNLRRTRDLLLPKLISGEVGVEELDIAV